MSRKTILWIVAGVLAAAVVAAVGIVSYHVGFDHGAGGGVAGLRMPLRGNGFGIVVVAAAARFRAIGLFLALIAAGGIGALIVYLAGPGRHTAVATSGPTAAPGNGPGTALRPALAAVRAVAPLRPQPGLRRSDGRDNAAARRPNATATHRTGDSSPWSCSARSAPWPSRRPVPSATSAPPMPRATLSRADRSHSTGGGRSYSAGFYLAVLIVLAAAGALSLMTYAVAQRRREPARERVRARRSEPRDPDDWRRGGATKGSLRQRGERRGGRRAHARPPPAPLRAVYALAPPPSGCRLGGSRRVVRGQGGP